MFRGIGNLGRVILVLEGVRILERDVRIWGREDLERIVGVFGL